MVLKASYWLYLNKTYMAHNNFGLRDEYTDVHIVDTVLS